MKHASKAIAKGQHQRSEIFPTLAVVQDHVQFQLGREFELCGEHTGLMRFPVIKSETLRWRMKIIEADLADGAHFGMPRQSTQFANPIVSADRIRIAGMNAHRHTYIRFVLGDGEELAGVFEIRGRSHHACDARSACARQYGGQIAVELFAAKVGVRVEKHALRLRIW